MLLVRYQSVPAPIRDATETDSRGARHDTGGAGQKSWRQPSVPLAPGNGAPRSALSRLRKLAAALKVPIERLVK
jgi:hypothetical protein